MFNLILVCKSPLGRCNVKASLYCTLQRPLSARQSPLSGTASLTSQFLGHLAALSSKREMVTLTLTGRQ